MKANWWIKKKMVTAYYLMKKEGNNMKDIF